MIPNQKYNFTGGNEVFDLGRCMMEVRRAFASRRRAILLGAVMIVSMVFLASFSIQYIALKNISHIYGLTTDSHDKLEMIREIQRNVPGEQALLFAAILLVGGCAASAMMFGRLVTRGERVPALMVPVSQFEKFMAQWLIFVPGFLAVFVVSTVAADLLRTLIFSFVTPPGIDVYTSFNILFASNKARMISRLLALYVFFSSFFGLGSVAWPRHSALKTIGLVSLIVIVVPLWSLLWHELLNVEGDPFASFGKPTATWIIIAIIGIGNWVLTWLALTETDLKTV